MQWLICYDIKCDKNRRKALKKLRQGSLGYQYSGFEHGLVSSPEAVLHNLHTCLEKTDRLLVLPRTQAQPNWHLGKGICTTNNHLLVFE